PYYPKLLCAVPFTPATGPRLLTRPDLPAAVCGQRLLGAMRERAQASGLSSVHALFLDEAGRAACAADGWLLRRDCHFQWYNRGYRDFEDFLGAFSAERRVGSAGAYSSRVSSFVRSTARSSMSSSSIACMTFTP